MEALDAQPGKVCELDVTGKTVEEVVSEIVDVLEKGKKCYSGVVDWLGMLEREGITDQYLKSLNYLKLPNFCLVNKVNLRLLL